VPSTVMGTVRQLPIPRRKRATRSVEAQTCPGCGAPVPASPTDAVYCSPECRVSAVREREDTAVRGQLARLVQCVEMLGVELERLIDMLAAPTAGRRR